MAARKPCPWCGDTKTITKNWFSSAVVSCANADCEAEGPTMWRADFKDQDAMVEAAEQAWDRRADDPDADRELGGQM